MSLNSTTSRSAVIGCSAPNTAATGAESTHHQAHPAPRDQGVGPSVAASACSPSSTRCTSRAEAPSGVSPRRVRPQPRRWPSTRPTHPRGVQRSAGRPPSRPAPAGSGPAPAGPGPQSFDLGGGREVRRHQIGDGPIRRLHRRDRQQLPTTSRESSLPRRPRRLPRDLPICSANTAATRSAWSGTAEYRVALLIVARRAIWSTATSKPCSSGTTQDLITKEERSARTRPASPAPGASTKRHQAGTTIQLRRPGRGADDCGAAPLLERRTEDAWRGQIEQRVTLAPSGRLRRSVQLDP